jgi:hypothetical protein
MLFAPLSNYCDVVDCLGVCLRRITNRPMQLLALPPFVYSVLQYLFIQRAGQFILCGKIDLSNIYIQENAYLAEAFV